MAPDLKSFARKIGDELKAEPTKIKAIEIGNRINKCTYNNRLLTSNEKNEIIKYLKQQIIVVNNSKYVVEANDDFMDLVDTVMSITNGGNR